MAQRGIFRRAQKVGQLAGAIIEREQVGRALTVPEVMVLGHVAQSGTCSIGDLHRECAYKPSTLTSILDRLVARGLVRRDLHPRDRRSFVLSPTSEGRALGARVEEALSALDARVATLVSQRDVGGFEAVVGAVDDLAHERRQGGGHAS